MLLDAVFYYSGFLQESANVDGVLTRVRDAAAEHPLYGLGADEGGAVHVETVATVADGDV